MRSLLHYRTRLLASLLLALVVALAPRLLARARPPVAPLPAAPIIDLHCHTAGIGAGGSGCHVSPAMRRSWKLGVYLRAFGVTREELEREGDALVLARISAQLAQSRHVSKAVVLALDGAVDSQGTLDLAHTEVYVPNEFLAAEVPKHPNLLWGASVNPLRHDALERLRWAHAHGAVLVKWLPAIQHIDPSDPRLIPYYDELVRLKLPLLTHTGDEHAFTKANAAFCDPARLRLPLQRGVTIIAAHAATNGRSDGEPNLERLSDLMGEFPNLYADISSLTQLNKRGHLAKILARPEMRDRLVYGTDFPLMTMRYLCSPVYFPSIGVAQMRAIAKIDNPWDRDVALKQALGVPTELWTRLAPQG